MSSINDKINRIWSTIASLEQSDLYWVNEFARANYRDACSPDAISVILSRYSILEIENKQLREENIQRRKVML